MSEQTKPHVRARLRDGIREARTHGDVLDALTPLVTAMLADAWAEGYRAGWHGARVEHKHFSGLWPGDNPYRADAG